MAKLKITDFYIYKWRYAIGYSAMGLLLLVVLWFAGFHLPGGITEQEMEAVVKSNPMSLTDISSIATANAPYHLLQKASFALFGVSIISIKLPSLILAFLSAIGLAVLLRRWFKHNVAVLTSILAVTTGQFIYIAQSGTAGILYMFWSVMLLLVATFIAKRTKPKLLWKSAFFIIAALSLYTPLSIYILLALILTTILHPHLRYIIRRLSKLRLLFALVLALIILAPLALGIIKTPQLGLTLLGIPSEMPNIIANLQTLSVRYFGFATAGSTHLMAPVFGLGTFLIIAYGLVRTLKTRQSTQSYIVTIWLICLLPVLIINPAFTSVFFLPLVLLLATGLDGILRNWYRLFPFNPYARIAGLIPLTVLVSGLVIFGLERYTYGYHYAPETVRNFSYDLKLLPKDTAVRLFATPDEKPFYTVVAKYNDKITLVNNLPENHSETLVTRQARNASKIIQAKTPSFVITNDRSTHADRFYVYKKDAK